MTEHRVLWVVFAILCVSGMASAWAGESGPRIVAHYYQEWDGSCTDAALEPQRGWYDNQQGPRTPSLIRSQAAEAVRYGISAFSVSWAGKADTRGDLLLRRTFLPAIDGAEGPFEWMVTFDSVRWALLHDFGREENKPGEEDNINFSSRRLSLVTGRSMRDQFASDMKYLCERYARDPRYLKIDGRPAVFLAGYKWWVGLMGYSIWDSKAACQKILGVAPYFIGDLDLAPRAFARDREWRFYDGKIQIIEALSDYTLFGDYGRGGEEDSALRFSGERLRQALVNGEDVAAQAGKPFYPGLIAQTFRVLRSSSSCGPPLALRNTRQAYFPLALAKEGADVRESSRLAQRRIFDAFRGMRPAPGLVFVTSWNDRKGGTMVEPTREPNGEGYVMGKDFLEGLRALGGRPAGGAAAVSGTAVVHRAGVRDESEAEACYERGLRLYMQGDLVAAGSQWREAARLNPEDERAPKALSRLLEEMKDSRQRRPADGGRD